MSKPAISVLLPVRDAGRYLATAVGDALAQTDVVLELIAVDDGSRDGSRQRLEAMAKSDSRLKVVANAGVGPARALDLALKTARHDWIAQMEADDRCPPDRLARLAAALAQQPAWGGVVSRAAPFGFRSDGMRRYLDWQNGLTTPEAMANSRFVEIPALHQSGLYRRAALIAAGGFIGDPRWPLDIDFWMRWHERGLVVGKVARVLYRWRQHALQSTRTSPLHRLEALRWCKAHYFARGPGRDRPLDLLSVGATLERFAAALQAEGQSGLVAHEWRPGRPLPPRREGARRLFAFGTEVARARVLAMTGAFDPACDWFAA